MDEVGERPHSAGTRRNWRRSRSGDGSICDRFVNAIGAIARVRVIENSRLKAALRCSTFSMPE